VSSSAGGRSAEAHHHVIVCHRTGSASNPYVVINIPLTAWHEGHSKHPAIDGRSDILLKDPASRPGSKDGFTKSACAAETTAAPAAATGTTTAAHTTSTTTTTTSTTTTTTGSAAGTGPGASGGATGGVAGAVASIGKPVGGVLGATAQLGAVAAKGRLPFTGLPLWAVALAGLGLITLGALLRRRERATI
jgi:hypothetical protein